MKGGEEANFQRTPQLMTEVSIAKSHKTPTRTWPQVPNHAHFCLSNISLDLNVVLKFLPRFIQNLNLKCNERRLKEEIWQQPFRFYSSSALIMEESGPGHLSAL